MLCELGLFKGTNHGYELERELTRAECVVLAGLPNAPSVYAANGELARRRALVVVERMERAKKLTHTQALELRDEVSALPLW